MKKKKMQRNERFVLFDILYEDGTKSSRRKIPAALIEGLDGEKPVPSLIEQQDRMIAEKSGLSRGRVKSFVRSPGQ